MSQDRWPSIGERGVQPARDPTDETLRLTRLGDKLCIATVSSDDKKEATGFVHVSLFNAFSLFGQLALFLGVKLPKKLCERIKL